MSASETEKKVIKAEEPKNETKLKSSDKPNPSKSKDSKKSTSRSQSKSVEHHANGKISELKSPTEKKTKKSKEKKLKKDKKKSSKKASTKVKKRVKVFWFPPECWPPKSSHKRNSKKLKTRKPSAKKTDGPSKAVKSNKSRKSKSLNSEKVKSQPSQDADGKQSNSRSSSQKSSKTTSHAEKRVHKDKSADVSKESSKTSSNPAKSETDADKKVQLRSTSTPPALGPFKSTESLLAPSVATTVPPKKRSLSENVHGGLNDQPKTVKPSSTPTSSSAREKTKKADSTKHRKKTQKGVSMKHLKGLKRPFKKPENLRGWQRSCSVEPDEFEKLTNLYESPHGSPDVSPEPTKPVIPDEDLSLQSSTIPDETCLSAATVPVESSDMNEPNSFVPTINIASAPTTVENVISTNDDNPKTPIDQPTVFITPRSVSLPRKKKSKRSKSRRSSSSKSSRSKSSRKKPKAKMNNALKKYTPYSTKKFTRLSIEDLKLELLSNAAKKSLPIPPPTASKKTPATNKETTTPPKTSGSEPSKTNSISIPSKADSISIPSKADSTSRPSKADSTSRPTKADSVLSKSSKADSVSKPTKVNSKTSTNKKAAENKPKTTAANTQTSSSSSQKPTAPKLKPRSLSEPIKVKKNTLQKSSVSEPRSKSVELKQSIQKKKDESLKRNSVAQSAEKTKQKRRSSDSRRRQLAKQLCWCPPQRWPPAQILCQLLNPKKRKNIELKKLILPKFLLEWHPPRLWPPFKLHQRLNLPSETKSKQEEKSKSLVSPEKSSPKKTDELQSSSKPKKQLKTVLPQNSENQSKKIAQQKPSTVEKNVESIPTMKNVVQRWHPPQSWPLRKHSKESSRKPSVDKKASTAAASSKIEDKKASTAIASSKTEDKKAKDRSTSSETVKIDKPADKPLRSQSLETPKTTIVPPKIIVHLSEPIKPLRSVLVKTPHQRDPSEKAKRRVRFQLQPKDKLRVKTKSPIKKRKLNPRAAKVFAQFRLNIRASSRAYKVYVTQRNKNLNNPVFMRKVILKEYMDDPVMLRLRNLRGSIFSLMRCLSLNVQQNVAKDIVNINKRLMSFKEEFSRRSKPLNSHYDIVRKFRKCLKEIDRKDRFLTAICGMNYVREWKLPGEKCRQSKLKKKNSTDEPPNKSQNNESQSMENPKSDVVKKKNPEKPSDAVKMSSETNDKQKVSSPKKTSQSKDASETTKAQNSSESKEKTTSLSSNTSSSKETPNAAESKSTTTQKTKEAAKSSKSSSVEKGGKNESTSAKEKSDEKSSTSKSSSKDSKESKRSSSKEGRSTKKENDDKKRKDKTLSTSPLPKTGEKKERKTSSNASLISPAQESQSQSSTPSAHSTPTAPSSAPPKRVLIAGPKPVLRSNPVAAAAAAAAEAAQKKARSSSRPRGIRYERDQKRKRQAAQRPEGSRLSSRQRPIPLPIPARIRRRERSRSKSPSRRRHLEPNAIRFGIPSRARLSTNREELPARLAEIMAARAAKALVPKLSEDQIESQQAASGKEKKTSKKAHKNKKLLVKTSLDPNVRKKETSNISSSRKEQRRAAKRRPETTTSAGTPKKVSKQQEVVNEKDKQSQLNANSNNVVSKENPSAVSKEKPDAVSKGNPNAAEKSTIVTPDQSKTKVVKANEKKSASMTTLVLPINRNNTVNDVLSGLLLDRSKVAQYLSNPEKHDFNSLILENGTPATHQPPFRQKLPVPLHQTLHRRTTEIHITSDNADQSKATNNRKKATQALDFIRKRRRFALEQMYRSTVQRSSEAVSKYTEGLKSLVEKAVKEKTCVSEASLAALRRVHFRNPYQPRPTIEPHEYRFFQQRPTNFASEVLSIPSVSTNSTTATTAPPVTPATTLPVARSQRNNPDSLMNPSLRVEHDVTTGIEDLMAELDAEHIEVEEERDSEMEEM